MPTLTWLGNNKETKSAECKVEAYLIANIIDERKCGDYFTQRCILEIYDQMTYCHVTNTEYHSTLNPHLGLPAMKTENLCQ